MEVTLLLCDSADEVGGKLYVLGGGWSLLQAPNTPVNMALAILIAVPWDQANRRHTVAARLMTDDGEPFTMGDQQVVASGELEVGRPAGMKPGFPLNTPVALKFNGLVMPPGGYRWEFEVDGTIMATAPFRVIG